MNPQEQNNTGAGSQANGSKEQNTTMAVIAYIIFFVPLFTDAKNDSFVKYHVHQGFVLFLSFLAVSILSRLLMMTFMIWPIISLLNIGLFILLVIGILNAVGGKQKPLPLIGQFASKFKF